MKIYALEILNGMPQDVAQVKNNNNKKNEMKHFNFFLNRILLNFYYTIASTY